MEEYQANIMYQNFVNEAYRANANNHYVNPLRARARARARGGANIQEEQFVANPTPHQIQQEMRMLGFAFQGNGYYNAFQLFSH